MKRFVYVSSISGLSGTTAPILRELCHHYELTRSVDPFEISILRDIVYRLISIRPGYYKWRTRYYRYVKDYILSDKAFRRRIAILKNQLAHIKERYDFIFQLSHIVYPMCCNSVPVYMYIDRTTRLGERINPESATLRSVSGTKRWDDLTVEAFNRSRRIFTFNDLTRESVIHDYGMSPSKVVNVGSGMNIEVPVFNKDYDTKQVMFVGADLERHGAPTALNVMSKLHEIRSDVRIVFIGRSLGSEYPYITSYKQVAHNTLQDLLRESCVLLMPSVMGGMQTIAEAMANKCVPVVADGNPYVQDVIVNGISGVLVPQFDIEGWVNAISKIWDERTYRVDLMDGCAKASLEKLTWKRAILRIKDEIEASEGNGGSGEI